MRNESPQEIFDGKSEAVLLSEAEPRLCYLNEGLFCRLLKRLLAMTRPSGEVVVPNLSDNNPSRPYMELIGDWRLIHRSANELTKLALTAGVPAQKNRD